jgi:hypothetical protein
LAASVIVGTVRVRSVSGPVHHVRVPSVMPAANLSICGPSAATTTPHLLAPWMPRPACVEYVSPENDTFCFSMSGMRIDRYSRM